MGAGSRTPALPPLFAKRVREVRDMPPTKPKRTALRAVGYCRTEVVSTPV